MIHFVIYAIVWFFFLAFLMSFIEHQIHRRLMHKKSLLSSFIPALTKVFEHHAILHHRQYSKTFEDLPVEHGKDRGLRLSLREGFFEALPISIIISMISLQGAVIFEIVVCMHHYIWNKIHLEMHKPEKRFFSNWIIYKFLARHHYLHHKYPDKNFNVVLPIADYILGTNAHASRSDLKAMHRSHLL